MSEEIEQQVQQEILEAIKTIDVAMKGAAIHTLCDSSDEQLFTMRQCNKLVNAGKIIRNTDGTYSLPGGKPKAVIKPVQDAHDATANKKQTVGERIMALMDTPQTARSVADALGMSSNRVSVELPALKKKGLIAPAGKVGGLKAWVRSTVEIPTVEIVKKQENKPVTEDTKQQLNTDRVIDKFLVANCKGAEKALEDYISMATDSNVLQALRNARYQAEVALNCYRQSQVGE